MPRVLPRRAFEEVTFLEAQVVSYKMDASDGGMWKLTFYVDEINNSDWLFNAYPRTEVVIGVKALDYDRPDVGEISTEGERTLKRAGMLCRNHRFQQFIKSFSTEFNWKDGEDEQTCVKALHDYLGIKSRRELLTNAIAIEEFSQLVKNFQTWLKRNI